MTLPTSPIPEDFYPDTGEVIDGIPQLVPEDGFYWVQVGRGKMVQWVIGYIKGMWVHLMIEVWHWSKPEFHEKYRVGPRLTPPSIGAEPYFPEHGGGGH